MRTRGCTVATGIFKTSRVRNVRDFNRVHSRRVSFYHWYYLFFFPTPFLKNCELLRFCAETEYLPTELTTINTKRRRCSPTTLGSNTNYEFFRKNEFFTPPRTI